MPAARAGDVHDHLGGDAAALRRVAARRNERGHRGDAHGNEEQSLTDASRQAVWRRASMKGVHHLGKDLVCACVRVNIRINATVSLCV